MTDEIGGASDLPAGWRIEARPSAAVTIPAGKWVELKVAISATAPSRKKIQYLSHSFK